MKSLFLIFTAFCVIMLTTMSCNKGEVNPPENALNSEVRPVDINTHGFELLERMKGHWVGQNKVLSWEWEWFAFDYRPISPSHIFGIYEGGTLGNLLTSFFVADFQGTRTIMARNGGVLSGLYRTSYFVLDSVKSDNEVHYYRFVDAVGGEATMFMELRFEGDKLDWGAYTSRLGENQNPTQHFKFSGEKRNLFLADQAAQEVDFPQNTPAWDFSNGFRQDYMYVIPDENRPKSASFLAQGNDNDVFKLAIESGDPFKIQDHPHVGTLQINIDRSETIQNDKLFLYLSFEPLTDDNGFLVQEAFESVLLFPDIAGSRNEFLFTYLHPGTYYLTIIADHQKDNIPGEGDITHVSKPITIDSKGRHQISINDINIQN